MIISRMGLCIAALALGQAGASGLRGAPPALIPSFSENPATQEFTQVRVFPEPLGRIDAVPSLAENRALATAINAYAARADADDLSALIGVIEQHPASPWNAALLVNLGLLYYNQGYFSKALASWQRSWELSAQATNPEGIRIANRAIAELIRMEARLGRREALTDHLAGIKSRKISGGVGVVIDHAREGLWLMDNRPGGAFKCGPFAVESLLRSVGGLNETNARKIHEAESTQAGTSLAQVQTLARSTGLDYRAARRGAGAPLIVPAVVHWNVGHYAALVAEKDGKYLIKDPTFGQELLVSRAALESESSGYFLVPEGTLPSGWQAIDRDEAGTVWGKGQTSGNDEDATCPCDQKTGSGCASCAGAGMAVYSVHALLASLSITDTPVGYSPPRGPAVHFTLNYSQRDVGQVSGQNYSNFGPQWTHDWFSYVQINSGTADVFERGGGTRSYTNFNSSTSSYDPQAVTRAILVRISSTRYEQRAPDGSKYIYGLDGGAGRFFLTAIVDPAGDTVELAYDSQFRLATITDALGQETVLSYDFSADPLRITQVTDPFGRFSTFDYAETGELVRITDVVGLTSEFTYNGSDITALKTGYGTTTFSSGTNGLIRWLEVTDPQGDKERTEYRDYTAELAGSEPYAPYSIGVENSYMYYRNTFYWDKKAMAEGYPDVHTARIYHWLHDGSLAGRILESEKKPYESRIWYRYPNQYSPISMNGGMAGSPSKVARIVLDENGVQAEQITSYEYNARGQVTLVIDPLGRKTSHAYDAGGIDRLESRQLTGTSSSDIIYQATYNNQHLPLTTTDAAGQTTTYTYNPAGQITAVTNPRNETITYAYDGDGYLLTITGARAGATTTYTHDGAGRIRTVTDSEGYTVTTDYDDLNRPTRVTYPDATYTETVYDKLDIGQTRDRLGRITTRTYNAIRQLIKEQDPLGRVTAYGWCKCGALARITDPLGRVTRWKHDVQGRMTAKIYPDGSEVTYRYEGDYDGSGVLESGISSRLSAIIDALGQETHYRYFIDDRVKEMSYTNATVATPSVTYAYDPVYPRIASMTDGTGTTTYAYHAAGGPGGGRVATVGNPLANSDINYAYDELGRVVSQSIDGNVNTSETTYDNLDRVTGVTNPLGTFGYDYVNTTGRVSAVSYPNGQVSNYTYYNNAGDQRLQRIEHLLPGGAPLSAFAYTYDANGTIQTWSRQTGTATPIDHTFAYDAADQLTGDTAREGSTVQKTYVYSYDAAGNRTLEQVDGTGTTASHDHLNQLLGYVASTEVSAVHFSGTVTRPSVVRVNGVSATSGLGTGFSAEVPLLPGTSTVSVSATDPFSNNITQNYQIMPAAGDSAAVTQITYDANGNTLSVSKAGVILRSYEWDAANRLLAINRGGQRSEFSYDGLSRRVKIVEKTSGTTVSTKQFIWDGQTIAEERDGSNHVTKRFYTQGLQVPGAVSPADKLFYTKDHLGSVRELNDAAGTLRARYDYDSYGRVSKLSGDLDADFGFTGHYHHKISGLWLTLYRAYDSNLGGWTNRDPLEERGGVNLYGYVYNNPINLIDPLGLFVPAPVLAPTLANPVVAGTVISAGLIAGAGYGYWQLGNLIGDEIIEILNRRREQRRQECEREYIIAKNFCRDICPGEQKRTCYSIAMNNYARCLDGDDYREPYPPNWD